MPEKKKCKVEDCHDKAASSQGEPAQVEQVGSLIERIRREGGLWPTEADWQCLPYCEICYGEPECTACSMEMRRLLVGKVNGEVASMKENDKSDARRLIDEHGISTCS